MREVRARSLAFRLIREQRSCNLDRTKESNDMAAKAKPEAKKKPAMKSLKVSAAEAKRIKGGATRYIK